MSMKEYFEAGYKVVCGSPWSDYEIQDLDDVECYSHGAVLEWVDESKKEVYFYDKMY